MPAGSRRARDQRQWLRAVGNDPEIAALRADKRHTVMELARVLSLHAAWSAMTAWRPRSIVCAEIGSSRDPSKPLSITAYKTARRVLEARGFLGLVAQGWTPLLRAVVLAEPGGTSAVFVLTVPRRKTPISSHCPPHAANRPLSRPRSGLVKPPHAREAQPLPPGGPAALGTVPETGSEALEAAQAMQERARILGRLSAEHLRSLARAFFTAGWRPSEILAALDYDPSGRQHRYRADVRSVGGWVRHRLAQHLDADGRPLPSPSQRRAAERVQLRAKQAEVRKARQEAAQRAEGADVGTRVAELRAIVDAVRLRQTSAIRNCQEARLPWVA